MTPESPPSSSPSADAEQRLLDGCIQKDKAAWDEFVESYSGLIYWQIHRYLRSRTLSLPQEDVDDLYHSVFQSLLENNCKKLRQFQGRCSLASWIKTITTTTLIDHLRRQRRQVSLDEEDADGFSLGDRVADPSGNSEEYLLAAERQKLLKQALKEISADDRLLAALIYQQAISVERIATVLKISKEAVYTRKHRLHERLRKSLEIKNML